MSRLIFCQKAYLGVLVRRMLEPLTIKQARRLPVWTMTTFDGFLGFSTSLNAQPIILQLPQQPASILKLTVTQSGKRLEMPYERSTAFPCGDYLLAPKEAPGPVYDRNAVPP